RGLVANERLAVYHKWSDLQFTRDRRGWNDLLRFVRRSLVRCASQRGALLELLSRWRGEFGARVGIRRDCLLWFDSRWLVRGAGRCGERHRRQVAVALPDGRHLLFAGRGR